MYDFEYSKKKIIISIVISHKCLEYLQWSFAWFQCWMNIFILSCKLKVWSFRFHFNELETLINVHKNKLNCRKKGNKIVSKKISVPFKRHAVCDNVGYKNDMSKNTFLTHRWI